MFNFSKTLVLIFAITISACTSPPKGVEPVSNFRAKDYLGVWYEIMRLDHFFERGLSNVTANYSLRDNNKIDVLNRGFHQDECEWKEAKAIAKFSKDETLGSLAVSFFRPFYAGYHIIDIDEENYSYAMITGSSKKYLWILARKPKLDEQILTKLINKAAELGFETDNLIKVSHNKSKDCFQN